MIAACFGSLRSPFHYAFLRNLDRPALYARQKTQRADVCYQHHLDFRHCHRRNRADCGAFRHERFSKRNPRPAAEGYPAYADELSTGRSGRHLAGPGQNCPSQPACAGRGALCERAGAAGQFRRGSGCAGKGDRPGRRAESVGIRRKAAQRTVSAAQARPV